MGQSMYEDDSESTVADWQTHSLTARSRRRATLLVHHRDGVRTVPLVPDVPVVLGRSRPADIVVNDRRVSRQHARVCLKQEQVWVEDLGSRNGIRLNGARVERARVGVGDQLSVGRVTVMLHLLAAEEIVSLGVDEHDRFIRALRQELLRAKSFRRKVALLMLRCADRGEGSGVRHSIGRLGPGIRQQLRDIDYLAQFSPNLLEVALPEADLAGARRVAHDLVRARLPGEDALVAGIAIYPDHATSLEKLLGLCREAASAATVDQPVRAAGVAQAETSPDGPIVVCEAMQRVYGAVARVATSAIPVLICGETGVGKELVAQALHHQSGRSGALRSLNCAAIPQHLLESALFGHERGAFTGADRRAKGIFEAASGGTVFLDEIGELPVPAQAALLRVLETQRVVRVGSTVELEVDTRVVAATHRDLDAMVEAGTFRKDLLYRLNAMPIELPPLRQRPEEIAPLVERFIEQHAAGRPHCVTGVTDEALRLLRLHDWPGNVRELGNEVARAMLVAEGTLIEAEDLSPRIASPMDVRGGAIAVRAAPAVSPPSAERLAVRAMPFKERTQCWEVLLLLDAFDKAQGSKAEVVRQLRIPMRTLTRKIRTYELASDNGRGAEGAARDAVAGEIAEVAALLGPAGDAFDFKERIERCERAAMLDGLKRAHWNKTEAARRLGMPVRTMVHKCRAFRLLKPGTAEYPEPGSE